MITGIKYISLLGAIGQFTAAKRYMLGLSNCGIPLTWTPLMWHASPASALRPYEGTTAGDPDLDRFCNRSIDYDTVIVHTPPALFPYWAEREAGRQIVGYVVWETDRLPRHWPGLLSCLKRILVPSRWTRDVCKAAGVTPPISVVPHICDGRLGDHPSPEGPYTFYTIETWSARKAVDSTIRCYVHTFTGDDSTVLVAKTGAQAYRQLLPPRLAPLRRAYGSVRAFLGLPVWMSFQKAPAARVNASLRRVANPPPVRLITSELDEDGIRDLHRNGDCYLSLTHAEAWGLGAFDAAAAGKPVIMTRFGGQLDFLPSDLAYLVNYRLVSARDDLDPQNFTADQRWAEADLAHASKLMRYVFEHRDEARAKGERLGRYVRETFSEARVIAEMMDAID
ncbi:MAG: glycosyltransferase family 1 protein [Acidobacteriota bacterium]